MVFGQKDIENPITKDGTQIQNVEEFEYLGSLVTRDHNYSTEIRWRIAKLHGAMAGFNTIWKSKAICINTKLAVLQACVTIALFYTPVRHGQ